MAINDITVCFLISFCCPSLNFFMFFSYKTFFYLCILTLDGYQHRLFPAPSHADSCAKMQGKCPLGVKVRIYLVSVLKAEILLS